MTTEKILKTNSQILTVYQLFRLIRNRNINKAVSFNLPPTTALSSVCVGTNSCYGTDKVRIVTKQHTYVQKGIYIHPLIHLEE